MSLRKIIGGIDWILFAATVPLLLAGWVTMNSFVGESYFAERQLIWIGVSLLAFFVASAIDWRFLRRTDVVVTLYLILIAFLSILFISGKVVSGAQSWFRLGGFSIQPADFMQLALVIVLAKYFTRRHVEIAHYRHILVSGLYAVVPFILVFLQPDFGSAIILFCIWLGMIIVSGVSKKHLALVFGLGAGVFLILWLFVFAPYQKDRIISFVDPLTDIQGAGYNAFQSTVAVGSGEIFGKGVGYGTQSRLQFLPEYQTDFIFAAFAEEWGLIGVLIVFVLFGVILWRMIGTTIRGATNFEILFGVGLSLMFITHFAIHVGMNIGILPVTGLPLPFMSYGGSHLLTEFIGLGILMGMRRYQRGAHQEDTSNELLDVRAV